MASFPCIAFIVQIFRTKIRYIVFNMVNAQDWNIVLRNLISFAMRYCMLLCLVPDFFPGVINSYDLLTYMYMYEYELKKQ